MTIDATSPQPPPGAHTPLKSNSRPATALIGAAFFVAAFLMYLLLLAPVINADGPFYIKTIRTYPMEYLFPAGHIFYDQACRQAWFLWRSLGYTGGLMQPMRGLSVFGAALGVAFFFFATTCLFRSRRLQVLLTLALAVSFGYWTEATSFIKPYSLSLGILMAALWLALESARRASVLWPLLAGIAAAAATMFHITNVFWVVFVSALMFFYGKWPLKGVEPRRRWRVMLRNILVAVGVQGVLVAAAYIAVYNTYIARHDQSGLLSWVKGADHEYASGFSLLNLAQSLSGFARAVCYTTTSWGKPALVVTQLLVFWSLMIIAGVLALRLRKRSAAKSDLFTLAAAVGALPYVFMGLRFYSEDLERWIWLVPLLLLVMGKLLESWWRAPSDRPQWRRHAVAVLALLALFSNNFFCSILPARLDDTGYTRAKFAAAFLKDGDLVVRPGHGWDEYISLFNESKYDSAAAAFFAYYSPENPVDIFRDPGTPETDETSLDRIIRKTLAAGHNVYVIRIFDPCDANDGWYVAREKGFTGASKDALIQWAKARFADREIEKFSLSYFTKDRRFNTLDRQLGRDKTRELAAHYLPVFRDFSREDLAYYLNPREYEEVKAYFDSLAAQDSAAPPEPFDPCLVWRALNMVPQDAPLYKLYFTQFTRALAGQIVEKDKTATIWRITGTVAK
jgi:hypothetical protein